ncbi:hypothetical protein BDR05DRAFT_946812 [Suillus weaverae]|nr:hypothetical protein BDR05DRAFT_946812 [Suillus weaverae]
MSRLSESAKFAYHKFLLLKVTQPLVCPCLEFLSEGCWEQAINVPIVLLPKDLTNICNEDATDLIDEDFYSVTCMHTGEDLASDLCFLSCHGLTKKLTLQHQNANHYVLDKLTQAIADMTLNANISFPSYSPNPLDLAPDKLNQDVCKNFHDLPFRFIAPGYSNAHQGQQYLCIDHSFTFQQLQFSAFQKKSE